MIGYEIMDAENNNLDIREIELKSDQGYIYHREGRYKEALECYRFVLESGYAPIAFGCIDRCQNLFS